MGKKRGRQRGRHIYTEIHRKGERPKLRWGSGREREKDGRREGERETETDRDRDTRREREPDSAREDSGECVLARLAVSWSWRPPEVSLGPSRENQEAFAKYHFSPEDHSEEFIPL